MNLPKPKIDREEAMKLWISERSDYAKEQVVLNNVGMVGIVLKSLKLNTLDEDLFSTGIVGIVKAVNTFNPDKGVRFSTYATYVIRNEILMYLRKGNQLLISLDENYVLDNGEEVPLKDIISDGKILEEEAIANIQFCKINNFLKEREKKIIFMMSEGKTQKEIGNEIGLSQSLISRIVKNVCNKFKKEFL